MTYPTPEKKEFYFHHEEREGLSSRLNFVCKGCQELLIFETSNKWKEKNIIHHDAVLGSMAFGIGRLQLDELLSYLEIPSLNQRIYKKIQNRNLGIILACLRLNAHLMPRIKQ